MNGLLKCSVTEYIACRTNLYFRHRFEPATLFGILPKPRSVKSGSFFGISSEDPEELDDELDKDDEDDEDDELDKLDEDDADQGRASRSGSSPGSDIARCCCARWLYLIVSIC